jgi:hypothetical protein
MAAVSLPTLRRRSANLSKGRHQDDPRDYAPEELAGGATLFHEHMSFADNFMTRWTGYAADTRRQTAMPGAPPPQAQPAARPGGPAPAPPSTPSGKYFMQDLEYQVEEMKVAKSEGVACIVDGGHAGMGRDILSAPAVAVGAPRSSPAAAAIPSRSAEGDCHLGEDQITRRS